MSDFWIITLGMQVNVLIGIALGYRLGRRSGALDPEAARGQRVDASITKQLSRSIERNSVLQIEIDGLRKQLAVLNQSEGT